MLVEVVFQYRMLQGRCELGLGLDWDQIDTITGIEAAFAPSADDRRMANGRTSRREPIAIKALMRGDRINDRVDVVELGLGGVVCRHAPYVAAGELIELVIDIGDASYRFSARGVWMRDDGDDYRIGLAFAGMPVALHRAQVSAHEPDLVDRISDAAIAA
jgi:hypothetical protein